MHFPPDVKLCTFLERADSGLAMIQEQSRLFSFGRGPALSGVTEMAASSGGMLSVVR